jgi:Ras-related C3 botulinum toxin substrate 1
MEKIQSITCVVLGDKDVGKFSLLASYIYDEPPSDYRPAVHYEFNPNVEVDGQTIRLELFIAHEYILSVMKCLNPPVGVFLICFSLVDKYSLRRVLDFWYPKVREFFPNMPIILVGTKLDLREKNSESLETVTYQQGLKMAIDLGCVKYLECSALTKEGLQEVFAEAGKAVLRPSPKPEKVLGPKARCCNIL